MKNRKTIVLELAGLVIVLLTAGWEFFVERKLTDISQDASFYRIERKLDGLWEQVGAIRERVEPNPSYQTLTISHADTSKEWPFAGDKREFESLARQTEFAKNLRGLAFVCGSLLLLIARGLQLRDSKKSSVRG